jgi:hypothetical protein
MLAGYFKKENGIEFCGFNDRRCGNFIALHGSF